MSETIVVDNLTFEVRRSVRRATLGLTVDRTGELVIHTPVVANEIELRRWLESKLLWVHRKLLDKHTHAGNRQPLELCGGETIAHLGRNYRLKIVEEQDLPIRFDGEWFRLRKCDALLAQELFRQWYITTGTPFLNERVDFWKERAGVVPKRIKCSELGYRWGSCGKNETLYFNWRLLQLEMRLIDYVVVHELVHLIERHHNKSFWHKFESVLPDCHERKAELDLKKPVVGWCDKNVA